MNLSIPTTAATREGQVVLGWPPAFANLATLGRQAGRPGVFLRSPLWWHSMGVPVGATGTAATCFKHSAGLTRMKWEDWWHTAALVEDHDRSCHEWFKYSLNLFEVRFRAFIEFCCFSWSGYWYPIPHAELHLEQPMTKSTMLNRYCSSAKANVKNRLCEGQCTAAAAAWQGEESLGKHVWGGGRRKRIIIPQLWSESWWSSLF